MKILKQKLLILKQTSEDYYYYLFLKIHEKKYISLIALLHKYDVTKIS